MSAPWSHGLRWTDLKEGPQRVALEADAPTMAAVAKALDLPAVKRLKAVLSVRPWLDGAEITGTLDAEVTQICGVTLDPFDVEIDDRFDVRLVPAGSPNAPEEMSVETMLDPEGDDPPDVIEGDFIDLAAYVVEHLALALDPFPRKPGAEFEPPEPTVSLSPFAALAALKTPNPKG